MQHQNVVISALDQYLRNNKKQLRDKGYHQWQQLTKLLYATYMLLSLAQSDISGFLLRVCFSTK